MRTISLAFLIVVLAAGTALAQSPGGTEPYPPPPPAPYPPQPAPYVPPPPQAYASSQGFMPVQLSHDDAELLEKGEISDNQHIGGVLGSVVLGFGIGQAVQGRYGETGWIFTLGEIGTFTAMMVGLFQSLDDCFASDATTPGGGGGATTCGNRGDTLLIGGLIGFAVFRVWEVVDAFTGPPKHNRKVRELKMRLGIPVQMYSHRAVPYINKSRDGGGTAGMVFRF